MHDSRQVLHRSMDTLNHVWRHSSIVVFMLWYILCRRHRYEELDQLLWDCSSFRFLGLLENHTWLVWCLEQGWWLVFGVAFDHSLKGKILWKCSFLAVLLDIWLEKNNKILEEAERLGQAIQEKSRFNGSLWALVSRSFCYYDIGLFWIGVISYSLVWTPFIQAVFSFSFYYALV